MTGLAHRSIPKVVVDAIQSSAAVVPKVVAAKHQETLAIEEAEQ